MTRTAEPRSAGSVRGAALGALLALLLPFAVVASVPRAHVSTAPAPASLGSTSYETAPLLAAPEDGGFALFSGDELARALTLASTSSTSTPNEIAALTIGDIELAPLELSSAAHDERLSLHLGHDVFGLEPLRGPPESYPETRIGGLELFEPFREGGERRLSLGLQWVCEGNSCGIASDQPKDPLGLRGKKTTSQVVKKRKAGTFPAGYQGPAYTPSDAEPEAVVEMTSSTSGLTTDRKAYAESLAEQGSMTNQQIQDLVAEKFPISAMDRYKAMKIGSAPLMTLGPGIEFIAGLELTLFGGPAAEAGALTTIGNGARMAEEAIALRKAAAAAAEETAEAANSVWNLGSGPRGYKIEDALSGSVLEGRLPPNFRTIDFFDKGVATSVKSIETTAPSYVKNPEAIFKEVRNYADKLADFKGAVSKKYQVAVSEADITNRQLFLGIPKTPLSPAQRLALERGAAYARGRGIDVSVFTVR